MDAFSIAKAGAIRSIGIQPTGGALRYRGTERSRKQRLGPFAISLVSSAHRCNSAISGSHQLNTAGQASSGTHR